LAARTPVVTFLDDLLNELTESQRAVAKDLLLRLHHTSLHARPDSPYAAYEPNRRPLADRLAVWSANLVLLTVLVGDEVMGSELLAEAPEDVAHRWRDEAMTWRARLTSEEWSGLISTIDLERLWIGEHRDVRLRLDDGTFIPARRDLYWTYDVPPGDPARHSVLAWTGHTPERIDRKGNFTVGKSSDVMGHALEPVGAAFPSIANMLFPVGPDTLMSPTHALLAALVEPYRQDGSTPEAHSNLVAIAARLSTANVPQYELAAFMNAARTVLRAPSLAETRWGATLADLERLIGKPAAA
jgi:hypothetical protein